MENLKGSNYWVFPDGDLPPMGDYKLKGHESIIILNLNDEEAVITLDLYFTDCEPHKGIGIRVGARRVRCVRTNNPDDMNGYKIPEEVQYAMTLSSNIPVVAQYGRLDTRDQPMHFYINQGYHI